MESCTALAMEHLDLEDCRKGAAVLRSDTPPRLLDGGVSTPVRLSSGEERPSWSDDDSEGSPPNTPDQRPGEPDAAESQEADRHAAVAAEQAAVLARLRQQLERDRREMMEAITETRRLRDALSAAEADRNRLQVVQARTAAELDAARAAACELQRNLEHETYRRKFFQALAEELKS